MQRKLRARTVGIIVMALLVLSWEVVVALSAEKDIRIGCLFPTTGRAGRYGLDAMEAAKMAAEEINNKGGVLGKKIELLFTDEKPDPTFCVRVAKRYILEDKVNFLMGVVSSAVGLAVTEVSKEHKVIFVGTSHATTKTSVENWHPYYFRIGANTITGMRSGALFAEKKPWKKYYYIGPDYEYGQVQWTDFWPFLKKLRPDVEGVGESWPKLYEPDYTPYITAILRGNPDVLVSGLWGGDTVAFIKQAEPYGLFNKMDYFHPDVGGNYEVFEALGEKMPKGLIMGTHHHLNWPDTDLNKEYVKKFHDKVGHYPITIGANSYVGVYFIAKAIEEAGSVDNVEALVKAMEAIKIRTPLDPPGYTSWIRPLTHDIMQWRAIGVTEPNDKYPPARYMLGKWIVFPPEKIIPSDKEVMELRTKRK